MRQLEPDEKLSLVMIYTPNMLVRGGLITRESIRVSIWLRNQGISNYVHVVNPQAIVFGGGAPRTLTYSEMYLPTNEVVAFHLVPPAADPPDYEASEANRSMEPVSALVGTFMIRGKVRISTQTDLGTSLDVMKTVWLSLYEAGITNPYMPQFNMQVPMLLVNAKAVSFGV